MIEKVGFAAAKRAVRRRPIIAPKKAKGIAKRIIMGWIYDLN